MKGVVVDDLHAYLDFALREAAGQAVRFSCALAAIARELSGVEWDVDTLDAIADHVRAAGFAVRDSSEGEA